MNEVKTFYVFHGEDEFSIAEQVKAMKGQMENDFNTDEYDGTKVLPGDVISAVRIVPFLGDKRLVIVHGMLTHLGKKQKGNKAKLDELVEALPSLPLSARLVFVENEELSKKHAVLRLANEHKAAYVKLFSIPKQLGRWLERKAQEYGARIEPQAAAALANVVSNDLRAADSEIIKLASYVGKGGVITSHEVSLLTSYVADADIFAMVDALGQRNGELALKHLKRLLVDSQPLSLFGMVIRQFRLILLAREWLDNGGSVSELPEAIGVHPFVAKKVAAQARNYNSIQEIENIYRHLLDTDVAIKTGKVKDQLGLEMFVMGLSRGD